MIPAKENSNFVYNMEQVLDTYKRPYNVDYPMVCGDESPKQLIGEIREQLSNSYQIEIEDDDFVRHCYHVEFENNRSFLDYSGTSRLT